MTEPTPFLPQDAVCQRISMWGGMALVFISSHKVSLPGRIWFILPWSETECGIQRLCRIDPKNRLTALDRCNTYNKGTTICRPESPPITITRHLSKYGVGKLYQSHTFNVTSVKFIYLVFIHSHARSVLSIGVYFAVSFVICATSDLLDAVNRCFFFNNFYSTKQWLQQPIEL